MSKKDDDWFLGLLLVIVLVGIFSAPTEVNKRLPMFVKVHLTDAIIVPVLGAVGWYWGGHAVGPTLWMSLIGFGFGRLSQWIQSGGR